MDPQQGIYDAMAAHQSRHHQGLGADATAAAPPPAPALSAADAAAQARIIAARLAAQLAGGSASTPSIPSVFAQPAPAPQGGGDLSDPTDPLAKARAIAARLGLAASGGSVLGKRRAEGDGFAWGKGDSSKLQNKIMVPVHTGLNYSGMLLGPKGSTLKNIEAESGARVYLRGRGTAKPNDPTLVPAPEDEEDMHVIVMADTSEQLAKATAIVEDILFNPGRAEEYKRSLASGGVGGAGSSSNSLPLGGGGSGSGYGPALGGGDGSSFTIPNPMVGFIIGKGGENIKELQLRTGTHVNVQKESDMLPGATERVITITGPPQGIADAKAAILNMVRARQMETGGGSGGGGGGGPSLQVQVPNDAVGSLIGRAGATIKAIQMRTGTHIQIPREPDAGNPRIRTITITSSSMEGVQQAQAEVMRVVQSQAEMSFGGGSGALPSGAPPSSSPTSSAPVPELSSLTMNVPNDRVGAVIGRGGLVIKEIQQRSSARVQMPREVDPSVPFRTVTITGTAQAVEQARAEIQNIIDTGHSPYPDQPPAPHAMHPHMQPSGSYGVPPMGYGPMGGYGGGYMAPPPPAAYGGYAPPPYYGTPAPPAVPAPPAPQQQQQQQDPTALAWQMYYAQQAAAASGGGVPSGEGGGPAAPAPPPAPALQQEGGEAGDSSAAAAPAPVANAPAPTGASSSDVQPAGAGSGGAADAAAQQAAWQLYYAQQAAWQQYYGGAAPPGAYGAPGGQ